MELEDGQSIEDFKALQEAELRKYEQDRGEKGAWEDLFANLTMSSPQQHDEMQPPPSRSVQHVSQASYKQQDEMRPSYKQPQLENETLIVQDSWGALPPKTTTTIAYSGGSSGGSASPPLGYSAAHHSTPPQPYPVSTSAPAHNSASSPLTPSSIVPTAKHHKAAATAGPKLLPPSATTFAGVAAPIKPTAGAAAKSKLLPPSAFLSAPAGATNIKNKPPTTASPPPGLVQTTKTPAPGLLQATKTPPPGLVSTTKTPPGLAPTPGFAPTTGLPSTTVQHYRTNPRFAPSTTTNSGIPSTIPPGLAPSTTNPRPVPAKHSTTTDSNYNPTLQYNKHDEYNNNNQEALPRRPRKVAKGRGKATLSSSGSTSSGSSSPPPPGFEQPRYNVNVGYGGVVQGCTVQVGIDGLVRYK